MMTLEGLQVGWYDGFIWKKGKQQGVATCWWTGAGFTSPDGYAWYPYKSYMGTDGFEPNVVSEEPYDDR